MTVTFLCLQKDQCVNTFSPLSNVFFITCCINKHHWNETIILSRIEFFVFITLIFTIGRCICECTCIVNSILLCRSVLLLYLYNILLIFFPCIFLSFSSLLLLYFICQKTDLKVLPCASALTQFQVVF